MNTYTDCYVAIIDVLGFKNLILKKKCSEILQLFNSFYSEYNIYINDNTNPFVTNEIVNMKVMSDTVCLYIDSSFPNALTRIIIACQFFQYKLLANSSPILSRGAIVKDLLYFDDDVLFGPAVNKAYLMEEFISVYPRIILVKSVISKSRDYKTKKWREIINNNVYLDDDHFMCVDSLFMFYCLKRDNNMWTGFVKCVNDVIDNETDLSIRQKYIYILNHINMTINKYNENKLRNHTKV